MSKFDHRIKRLETRTGGKRGFDYWLVTAPDSKRIQDIEAGKVAGKMGSRFGPEKKNLIIISGLPRPSRSVRKEKETSPPKETSSFQRKPVADLTDEELAAEIRDIQKELNDAKVKTAA